MYMGSHTWAHMLSLAHLCQQCSQHSPAPEPTDVCVPVKGPSKQSLPRWLGSSCGPTILSPKPPPQDTSEPCRGCQALTSTLLGDHMNRGSHLGLPPSRPPGVILSGCSGTGITVRASRPCLGRGSRAACSDEGKARLVASPQWGRKVLEGVGTPGLSLGGDWRDAGDLGGGRGLIA